MSRCIGSAPTLPNSATVGVLLLLFGATACDAPNFEGPQLQEAPQGYLLQPDPFAPREMFAYLPAIHHDAWVQSLPPYSTIKINGVAGTLTLEDVMVAQDSMRGRPHDPDITFGPVERLAIDGREARGWKERIETPQRGVPWVAYRAMVPYDTISYTIELSTEDPLLKAGAPETVKAIISTFGVGVTVWNLPLLALGVGLLLFAIHIARQKAQAKAARLQSITLRKIEKKESPEADAEASVAAVPAGEPAPEGTTSPNSVSAQQHSAPKAVVDVGHEGRHTPAPPPSDTVSGTASHPSRSTRTTCSPGLTRKPVT